MDWYKNLAENIATRIIGNAHDKFFKEGKNLDFMGVTVFEEADSFDTENLLDVIKCPEAEKIFNAFDKVPPSLWEEEYPKYSEVLNKYQDIKVKRWNSN